MRKKTVLIFISFLFFALGSSWMAPPPPPPGAIGPYLNGAFPDTSPNTNWELEDMLPDFTFQNPLRLEPFPQTEDYLLLCKSGEIWRISFSNKSRERVLDIRNRTFDKSEAGSVGMAIHPDFGDATSPDQQTIFVFYRFNPDPDLSEHLGYNRLSKFTWDEDTNKFDEDSEEILIQQYDRNAWHNGGGMFFGNDGFLYISLGDEGILLNHPAELHLTTQRLDLGLFNGIIRIDIDNDPTRSHPIIRQPQSPAPPMMGWEGTFTQGYSIPNDNPWLNAEGEHLEEFFAMGVRSPYSLSYDKTTDQIWLADVGSVFMEEISLIEKGDNLQWPYMEGTLVSDNQQKPDNLIGEDAPPIFTYGRSVGTCIIGGAVYRSNKYPQLYGKYLFSDWVNSKIWAIPPFNGVPADAEVLVDNISGGTVQMLDIPGVTGIFIRDDGEILVPIMDQWQRNLGKIYRLVRKEDIPSVAEKLSEVGAFNDLTTLDPAIGLIPYDVNAPLWSDRALKKRWVALPNDGGFDTADEQIVFSKNGDWDFPPGSVFVKHFELPLTTDLAGSTARLETRFFIIDKNGQGYGLTYVWNEEGTEAYLQNGGATKDFEITENGSAAFTQTWEFPSRDQCLSCHNHNANYVLGLKTHQLNKSIEYPSLGYNMNQLSYFNEIGAFTETIGSPSTMPKAADIADESANLDLRVRSYMDANCSFCHRPGGINQLTMDLRFSTPLEFMNIIRDEALSQASPIGSMLVEPGSHETSEIWIRDASLTENRMPPLARNVVDETYIDALADWIDGLPEDSGKIRDLIIYPNPTNDMVNVYLFDDWEGAFTTTVFTANGQVIFRKSTTAYFYIVDLTNYPSGTYLIEVSSKSGRRTKKVVKR